MKKKKEIVINLDEALVAYKVGAITLIEVKIFIKSYIKNLKEWNEKWNIDDLIK